MHLLQPIALLACAAVTSGAIHVARDPKQADFSIPTSNGTGGPAPARTNGTMPVTGELTMPKDAGKNCHGSHFCLSLLPPICKSAAARYLDNRTYTKRTSYVFSTDTKNYTGESFSGSGCTAIWVCEKGFYGKGMTGKQIKLAFAQLWRKKKGEKHCKRCGSFYMANRCHVTANYCARCNNRNT